MALRIVGDNRRRPFTRRGGKNMPRMNRGGCVISDDAGRNLCATDINSNGCHWLFLVDERCNRLAQRMIMVDNRLAERRRVFVLEGTHHIHMGL